MSAHEPEKHPITVIPDVLPVLPLRDTVLFPMAVTPLLVGQERSIRLIDDVMGANRMLALVVQKNLDARPAGPSDLYHIGTAAVIQQLFRAPDGALRIIVQGLERIRIGDFVKTTPYLVARVERFPSAEGEGLEVEALVRTVRDLFKQWVALVPELPDEMSSAVEALGEPCQVVYLVASSMTLTVPVRQEILELEAVPEKLRRLIALLQHELAVRELGRKITDETKEQMSRAQRDYFLREQLKAIQRELGEENPEQGEVRELRSRLEKMSLPQEVRKEAERELSRLESLPTASPEHGMIRTYLDWLLSLPWNKSTGAPIDVPLARKILDEDHYDLEKVKDRILEYLAVKRLREARQPERSRPEEEKRALQPVGEETRREPILCFVGPPGVGKTSLGQSIARAMGRKFVRMSLGGVHDEAEIRGHRRTYIGAMPGRIIQTLRRAEAADPVFMLDEVDKLGVGFHGDPSAALLEVLDPAQNQTFVDTYLNVPFDLSKVLFICTANTVETIPPPLLDRMELLTLSGYTEEEKLHIARRYLLPNQIRGHGLRDGELLIDDDAIRRIVCDYTREAGVRGLERQIAAVVRKAARRISEGEKPPVTVRAEQVPEFLGAPRFLDEVAERIDRPGIATGLAWTPVGGDVLFVEAAMMPGREERLILTGMLGDVMRESAQAALSYLRSNTDRLRIDPKVFEGKVVHIHVPAGAIPKDGPSAGVTMLAALASLVTGRPVRNNVAMTGEITLRGKVLPVGGIKEKVLAAYRFGIKTVILPRRNVGALEDVPAEVRDQLQFKLVDSVEEVVVEALSSEVVPVRAVDGEKGEGFRQSA